MAVREIQVLRATDRFRTETSGITTTHEFSFGPHYDPARTAFGLLQAHNVETIRSGNGYSPHVHRDVEILTWVTAGTLEHNDDHGHSARLKPGMIQRLTASSGVTHSEINADRATAGPDLEFVQMWLRCPADELASGEGPSYEVGFVDPQTIDRGLVELASGQRGDIATSRVSLRTPGVTLWGANIEATESRRLPVAALLHVYVVSGMVNFDSGERLSPGDSASVTDSDDPVLLTATENAHLLALTMPRRD